MENNKKDEEIEGSKINKGRKRNKGLKGRDVIKQRE